MCMSILELVSGLVLERKNLENGGFWMKRRILETEKPLEKGGFLGGQTSITKGWR